MKKLFTTLTAIIFISFLTLGQSKQQFLEVNVGIAGLYDYDFSEAFPGMSVLYGQTKQISDICVGEWQAGLALPSIVTAKIGLGFGSVTHNAMISVRPWPLTIGPQVRLGRISTSFEFGTTEDDISVGAGLIATFGYRFIIKNKKQKEAYKKTL
jgi:hypothetical protein